MESVAASRAQTPSFFFHKSDVPITPMGHIHALTMQLLAKGLIELKVSDCRKVGTKELNDKHIIVSSTPDFFDTENRDLTKNKQFYV